MTPRPPIIVIVGHIDHGKSSLLDHIRKTNVVAGEAGGITQHMSAYEVTWNGKQITFLDTPGHAAFSGMRVRGATVADVAVLVISAEEGVKDQTLEAHRAIEAAGIPMVVAITKIDRPNASVDRVKQSLAEAGILVEGYGGTVPWVAVSSKTGDGVPDLLDLLLLAAELENLASDPKLPARGYVLEANVNPRTGITATLVITDGTLLLGDFVVVGPAVAKLKRIEDFRGQAVKSARFSSPVRVTGFAELPVVGEPFSAFDNKKQAEAAAATATVTTEPSPTTDASEPVAGSIVVPLLLKTDVSGTLEALAAEVARLETDRVTLKIFSRGVGTIVENDVKTAASAERPIIIGFNVKTDSSAVELAERLGVTVMTFDIIYKVSEWLSEEIARRLPKLTEEIVAARAKIIKPFSRQKDRQIIGGAVLTGTLKKGAEIIIKRREVELGRGRVLDLESQRVKVPEAKADTQFGATVDSKIVIAAGDILEAVETVER